MPNNRKEKNIIKDFLNFLRADLDLTGVKIILREQKHDFNYCVDDPRRYASCSKNKSSYTVTYSTVGRNLLRQFYDLAHEFRHVWQYENGLLEDTEQGGTIWKESPDHPVLRYSQEQTEKFNDWILYHYKQIPWEADAFKYQDDFVEYFFTIHGVTEGEFIGNGFRFLPGKKNETKRNFKL